MPAVTWAQKYPHYYHITMFIDDLRQRDPVGLGHFLALLKKQAADTSMAFAAPQNGGPEASSECHQGVDLLRLLTTKRL
jgi:hypothetical protein